RRLDAQRNVVAYTVVLHEAIRDLDGDVCAIAREVLREAVCNPAPDLDAVTCRLNRCIIEPNGNRSRFGDRLSLPLRRSGHDLAHDLVEQWQVEILRWGRGRFELRSEIVDRLLDLLDDVGRDRSSFWRYLAFLCLRPPGVMGLGFGFP